MMQELTRLKREKHELINRITTLKQHILELESQESEAIREVLSTADHLYFLSV